jgi:hypothetical protein
VCAADGHRFCFLPLLIGLREFEQRWRITENGQTVEEATDRFDIGVTCEPFVLGYCCSTPPKFPKLPIAA